MAAVPAVLKSGTKPLQTEVEYEHVLKNVDESAVVDRLVSIRCFFTVEYANPQGDTEGNIPRTDPITGIGLITPVGIRRHIRDYLEARFAANIFVKRNSNLAEQTRNATDVQLLDVGDDEEEGEEGEELEAETAEAGKKAKKVKGKKPTKTIMADELKEQVITDVTGMYADVAAFGQVLTKPINRGITGPVQFTISRSVHPVDVLPFTLTRCAVASDEEKRTKDRTMGDSAASVVRFGLYFVDITVNPVSSRRTGFTWGALNQILDALQYMWTMKKATSRSGVNFHEMFVFLHKGPFCSVPERKLFRAVKVLTPNVDPLSGDAAMFSPNSMDDYKIELNMDGIQQDRIDVIHVN